MKHKATNRLPWLTLALLPVLVFVGACGDDEVSQYRYAPCPVDFDGVSCPDDCWEVRATSSSYRDCPESELLLGCASGPQELPTPPSDNAEAGFGAISRSNGLIYFIEKPYYTWFEANRDRFCRDEGESCPEPDAAIVDACEARE